LKVEEYNSDATWREIFCHCSRSLKHLSLEIHGLAPKEEIPPLQFPHLEVLEMDGTSLRFPAWMVVPPTLKLFTFNILSNLPPIRDLWAPSLVSWRFLSSRCPNLQVIRSELGSSTSPVHLSTLLRAKRENVERGFEVDNVKMKPLKKLVIPFNKLSAEALEECRELVREVVDWESEPGFWEIEI